MVEGLYQQSVPLWHAVANKLIDPQKSQWYNYVTDIPSSAVSKGADLMKLTVESHEFGPVKDNDLVSYDGMKITLKYNGYCITGILTSSCFGDNMVYWHTDPEA